MCIDRTTREIMIDCEQEVTRIGQFLRTSLRDDLKRKGYVIGVSGGIDSAVCAALCVQALGANKVYALLMPEQDSSDEGVVRARALVDHLGLSHQLIDIAPTLKAIGCYTARDEAIQRVFPEYSTGWKNKIVINGGQAGRMNSFQLVVEDPQGRQQQTRLRAKEYQQIVAATNYKQRIRKTLEYFHADRLHYAVIGTPNLLEFDQGFFVKHGDGAADVKPIAHLYKTQVYALARHLGLPESICNAEPTTDTYSLTQGQDEFYYGLPYREMDVALWCLNQRKSAEELAQYIDISVEHARYIYEDISTKRKTTHYLHAAPLRLG